SSVIVLSRPNQVPRMMSATPTGVSASQNLRGVTARKVTGVENSARRAVASLAAIAPAICAPSEQSVAERVGCLIAGPPPHRHRATKFGIAQQMGLVEVLGV